jgi:uncharacterized protein (TIGR03435 family)
MNEILAILTALINSLWQAAAVAAIVWTALRFWPRTNAATRYAIWWATLAVVLILPAAPHWIATIRHHAVSTTAKTAASIPAVTPLPDRVELFVIPPAPRRAARWPIAVLGIWAAILAWRLYQIGRSYLYLHSVKRRAIVSAIPLPDIPRRADLLISSDIASPMALGFRRPAVVLPDSLLAELSDTEREHVLLHEAAHLVRRDDWANLATRFLAGALALHPVAIWILWRIDREREIACDEWVVSRTGAARPYAASLARLFDLLHGSGNQMLASGIFGRGSRIGDRVEALLRRGRTFTTCASVPALLASAMTLAGLMLAGSFAPRWIAFAQEEPRPSFEVASVRENPDCVGDHQDEQFSPGRVSVTCMTLPNLIQAAYVTFADGLSRNPVRLRVFGLPDWARSDRFNITAKARGDARMEQMFGPMLETLLEDRFGLTLHRETRELPVYIMTPANGGLRIKATKEGSCIALDLNHANETSPKFCGRMTGRVNGERVIDDAYGMTMAEIASRFLANRLDRPVIDQTGIAGTFDAHLEFSRDNGANAPGNSVDDSGGLSIFTAVQAQLGLELKPARGPVETLVVDHAEKPDAN